MPTSSRRNFITTIGGVSFSASTNDFDSFLSAPTAEWRTEVSDDSFAAPLVVDENSIFVSTKNSLSALSTSDGGEKWRLDARQPFFESGDIQENTLYIDSARDVSAIDVSDGTKQWAFNGGDALAVGDETVYVVDSSSGTLSALTATTGAKRWQFESDIRLSPSVVLDENGLYVATSQGTVCAVSPEDGTERWRFELSRDGFSSPTTKTRLLDVVSKSPDSGTLYVWRTNKTDSCLYAVSTIDGTEKWQFRTTQSRNQFPGVITRDLVTINDGSLTYAFSPTDGTPRWKFTADDTLASSSRLADGTLYLATTSGIIYAVSAIDGTKQWDATSGSHPKLGTNIDTSIAVGSGHKVNVLSTTDGSRKWTFDSDDGIAWPPHLIDDTTVCFGTKRGTVYVVDAPDGTFSKNLSVNSTTIVGGALLGGGCVAGAYWWLQKSESDENSPSRNRSFHGFELLKHINSGQYVESYEARLRTNEGDSKTVTLKRVRTGVLSESDSNEWFKQTIEEWAELRHENIAPVHCWGVDPVPWVALEHTTQNNLSDCIDAINTRNGIEAISMASEALHCAHENDIIPANITPQNILFPDGNPKSAIVDLFPLRGLCPGYISRYSAPEQAKSNDHTNGVYTDVYRLGAITYRLVTGQLPSDGDGDFASGRRFIPPSDLNSSFSEHIDDVLATALAKDPQERYESALKFRDALHWAVFVCET